MSHTPRHQSALIAVGLIIFMSFSVFAFAATEDWSATVCEATLFLLIGWIGFKDPSFFRFPKRLWAPFVVVLILITATIIQLLPLPKVLWRWVGDERGTIQERALQGESLLRSDRYRTNPLTGRVLPKDTDSILSPPPKLWLPATFTPFLTLRALLALLAGAALILLLEALAVGNRYDLRIQATAVGVVGSIVGISGLIHFREAPTKVLGLRESIHASRSLGPFINQNNGMGFVNLALFLFYYALWKRATRDNRISNRVGYALAALAILGLHATLLAIRDSGAAFWPILLLPPVIVLHALRHRPRLAIVLVLLVLLCFGSLSLFAVHFRFTDFHGRLALWRNALNQSHWFIGNGLGSFGERIHAVLQDLPIQYPVHWVYLENEYLQLVFEVGLPGLGAAFLAAGYVLHLGWKSLMAGGSTCVLVPVLWGEALHAATDFTFHIWPIVFATLLLIAIMERSLDIEEHCRSGPHA